MTIIDSQTVVVYNSNELKTVLEGNNTYNYIYFGANIKLTAGIIILPTKTNITIDGTYENVRYTYEDMDSSSAGDTISIRTASSMQVTVKNINVNGRNYYGVVCVYDVAGTSGVVLEFNNVVYTGPQITYAKYVTTRYIDSQITIQNGYSPANEVAEARQVVLGGNVTINSTTTANAVFWLTNVIGGVYPSITVLEDANVTITAEATYLYYVSSAAYINTTFGRNSTTNITTARGMGYDNNHPTSSVLIDSDASLNVEQLEQFGSSSTWAITGEFKMNSGSSLVMVSDYSGSNSNYCLLFSGSAALNFNNPRRVVFYNNPATAIRSSSTTPFSFNIPQYNRWTSILPFASSGDINNIPNYSWYKIENTNNLVVSGNITTSATNITSTNLTPAELAALPALSNFLINNTKVLSMGRPSITIDPITDLSTDITGTTTPNADVRISYDGNDHYVVADANGDFTYSYSPPLAIGTEISFVSNVARSFLYRFRTVEIIYPGDLFIASASNEVDFSTVPFQTSPTLCGRISNLEVIVEDSRITPTVWNLYAAINEELTNEKGSVLTDGLVYVDSLGNMTVLSTTPTLVYTSDGVTTGEITVNWPNDEGILLQLNIVPITVNTTYKTDINWSIE
ncbi:MAG: hypothetical protein PHN72_06455 [Bacilli bacterium]|nr:hypothetical protein [Bacilli bacterium]